MTDPIPAVTRPVKLLYALPGLWFAAAGVGLFIHLPKFYADVVGVDLTVLGAAILAARIVDGLADPVVGVLSDRMRSRFGRRRPFIAAGTGLAAGALAALHAPPEWSSAWAGLWFTALLILLALFWTLAETPWEALGAELSPDYAERTAIFGLRDGAMLLGVLLAAAAPVLLELGLGLFSGDARGLFATLGALYAPGLAISGLVCASFVRERPAKVETSVSIPLREGLGVAAKNRALSTMLVAGGLGALGSSLPGVLIGFYSAHVLGIDGGEAFLLVYVLAGVGCLPLWIRLAGRIGKRRAYAAALGLNAAAFLPAWFLGPGDSLGFALVSGASGLGFGATLALPASMLADAVDVDELETGERREGLFMSLWSLTKKAASALGLGLALPLLEWAGYQAGAENQPEAVVQTIKILYILLPCACSLAAIRPALAHPLDAAEHAAIRERLAARRAA